VLSVDGSRQVDDRLDEGNDEVTVDSQLDHYCARPTTPHMDGLTLMEFVQRYRTPKKAGIHPICRRKEVVVIVRPFCSPDPQGPKYEQYCRQKLMLHQPFRQLDELLGGCENNAEAYSTFLRSGVVPPSIANDIRLLESARRENPENDDEEVSYNVLNHLITF
jgi:hypothetical protein